MGDAPLSSISVQGNVQGGGKLVAVGDVKGTVSLLEVRKKMAMSTFLGTCVNEQSTLKLTRYATALAAYCRSANTGNDDTTHSTMVNLPWRILNIIKLLSHTHSMGAAAIEGL